MDELLFRGVVERDILAVRACVQVTYRTGAGAVCNQSGTQATRCQRSVCYRTGSGSTGFKHSTLSYRSSAGEIVDCMLNAGSGRYSSRFCKTSTSLRNGINSMKTASVPQNGLVLVAPLVLLTTG
jgi:hypothetical protein